MISRHKVYFKDGTYKTQIRVVEGYRPGPNLPPKQRQIKNFGYLEDHVEDRDDFLNEVEECNNNLNKAKEKIEVSLDPNLKLNESKRLSLGHKYLEPIYNFLELDSFFEKLETKATYDVGKIFKFLVLERILDPDSKFSTCQIKEYQYNEDNDFEYHQVMRALDFIDEYKEELQDHLNKIILEKAGRNTEYMFYDTSNVYVERDYALEGHLPQKGVSKEHRTEPIVQFGLLMDSNYLPVRLQLFPGNTSDSKTYLPVIKSLKEKYGLERLIAVADKGMNSDENISYLYFNGDGYVFSQILKGKKGKRYHELMFEDDKFTYNSDRTYKYRLVDEEYTYKEKDSKGKVIREEKRKRKVLIYWKESIARREKEKRNKKILQAQRALENNAYGLTHDATKYLSSMHYDSSTGIIADKEEKEIDFEKIHEDEKFDGFFCIVTSELNYDSHKIPTVYNQLSKIEEAFRICKSTLGIRPLYVWSDKHISAHFQICFTSLLILRLIKLKLKDKTISEERIQRTLSSIGVEEISKGILRLS